MYSDGKRTPEELCRMASEASLTHIALCDHDTLLGVEKMAASVSSLNKHRAREGHYQSLTFIPSVEMSAGANGHTHILGFGAQVKNKALQEVLQGAVQRRSIRFDQMLAKLSALGIKIPAHCLPQKVPGSLGRAHLARALVAARVTSSVKEAFIRFLGDGKPAYVAYQHQTVADVIPLLRQAGAVPVLAHPWRIGLKEPALFALIQEMQSWGLMGVEVYHPSASGSDCMQLEAFARRQGLLVTGGSDYHGDVGLSETLGADRWISMTQDVEALLAHIPQYITTTGKHCISNIAKENGHV